MEVQFIASDPRLRAKPILDQLLTAGTKQIAIACAFLTPGGVELLKQHAQRLRSPGSFVVVAWESPTSLDALNDLYAVIPGHVYVHLGSLTPVERGGARVPGLSALMHSKVFFARGQDRCWLWTGSHNLTVSATQGANCEAAVLVEGTFDEPVFKDALDHLNRCRSEATLFDPVNPPPPLSSEHTLVIHAECRTSLKNTPWFVHLRPTTTEYDKAMRPPAGVWLYLYEEGSLRLGKPRPTAKVAYSGTLTALNFTETHPQHHGITADWRGADYVIEIENGIPCLIQPRANMTTPSQGIFRVEEQQKIETVWLTESPAPKLERVVGATWESEVDPEFRKFFTTNSLRKGKLRHQEYRSFKTIMRLPRKEVGNADALDLRERLSLPAPTELEIDETLERTDRFAFIYRAKYRT
jgi:hypothetical protein